jgi:hypothetical protein
MRLVFAFLALPLAAQELKPTFAPPQNGQAFMPSPDSMTVTISPQQSPYKLPSGLRLYSAVACATAGTRARAISAGYIRQVAEGAGIAFQDPATLPPMISTYVAHTWQGRLLGVLSYSSTGGSIASAAIAANKAGNLNVGNARVWAEAATALGALGAAVPIVQKTLQSSTQAQQASITNGVKAALMSDMSAVYEVPLGGCSRSVMFLGAGAVGVTKVVVR